MFLEFFYRLRAGGLEVTPTEWLTLMEGLEKGLAASSLTGFYQLCRAVLVKSESDYDKFDAAFLDFFKGLSDYPEVPDKFLAWLDKEHDAWRPFDEETADFNKTLSAEAVEAMFRERLAEQDAEHNHGTYWIGTNGMSTFGHDGANREKGIRVGGEGAYRRAMRVAGERRFRDFTLDRALGVRQYQVALRRLRQFSGETNAAKTEFDVDGTIQATGDNAGRLQAVYRRPRRNTVKLLLLIDSGGSMDDYTQMVTALFQAVRKSNHFQDLKIYYFHNCVYQHLYLDPTCTPSRWLSTESVLHTLDGNYKLIILGDATMAPYELMNYRTVGEERLRSLDWFRRLKTRFRNHIWLNPTDGVDFWNQEPSESYVILKREFPMFLLTVENLEAAFRRLLVSR